MDILISLTAVSNAQCTNILGYHIIYIKYIQFVCQLDHIKTGGKLTGGLTDIKEDI